MAQTWLLFVIALCSPIGMLLVVSWLLRWLPENQPPRWLAWLLTPLTRYAQARRPVPEPLPSILIELELRRIAHQLAVVERSDQPHKAQRVDAWRGAYDLALADLARSLGEDPPAPPLSPSQRTDLELTLVGAGHSW
ncbi:MAG: hypothetical protein KBB39_04680 [Phycicoccus sp.]|nr:hypothetical protein [Phycicoccus sp.]